ncbi:Vancomycin resistance protein YoaR, contains peptidoglycan-binding and VanW domains [Prauserella aidingensis]|uniref:VanW family protein n=1 Tax=Prauserella aidingensis TaxID=387890 RepID=UPI0020A4F966|nr:VanW family protein [Prauserella aidingensis]MCP2251309.1 Vancomycin resistance protein YoaR, contains peptidoglycan-binding and VanW domains [Prauserella aidingensis]
MAQDDDSVTPDPATPGSGDVPDPTAGTTSASGGPTGTDEASTPDSGDIAQTDIAQAEGATRRSDAVESAESHEAVESEAPNSEAVYSDDAKSDDAKSEDAGSGDTESEDAASVGAGEDVGELDFEPDTGEVTPAAPTGTSASAPQPDGDPSETAGADQPAWPSETDAAALGADHGAAATTEADGTGAAAEQGSAAADDTAVLEPVDGTESRDSESPDTATQDTGSPDTESDESRKSAGAGLLAADVPWRRVGVIAAAVVGVLVVLYGLDLLINQGDVARGRTVAGVDVAGQSREDAERTLRRELDESSPVTLTGGGEHTLAPESAGLAVDWQATLDAATDQPLNPFARVASLFTTEDIGLVSTADSAQLDAELERLRDDIDREASEGTIRFDGTTPVPVDPVKGRELDVAGAKSAILARWATPDGVELPVRILEVRSTPDTVRDAVADLAEPAVSAPVTIRGEGAEATVRPRGIARSLTFDVRDDGTLTAGIDEEVLREVAGPQLASTEDPGRDARFTFEGGSPTIRPSTDGYGVDWATVAKKLPGVLTGDGERSVTAPYGEQPAELTTKEAQALGIEEVVGEFTTSGFAYDSGLNIKQVAREVNGAIVEPGETFSLNEYTGPRGVEQGYVSAGIISGGQASRAVGGGISQFATTLYNAYYFAGLKDVDHQEHSYYISRYPVGREATVFQNPDGSSVIDLKFKNDSPNGIVIQTIWTPSDITVKLWGTKRYEIESVNGGRYNYTAPPTEVLPASESCVPSSGSSGFSTNDTRVFKDPETGEVIRREKRDVVYRGQTAVVCLEPEPEPEPPDGGGDGDSGDGNGDGGNGGDGEAPGNGESGGGNGDGNGGGNGENGAGNGDSGSNGGGNAAGRGPAGGAGGPAGAR